MTTLKNVESFDEADRWVTLLATRPDVRNHDTALRAALLLKEMRSLFDLGWHCRRITATPLKGQATLTFTALFRSASGTRTIAFTVRKEHMRYQEPRLGVFVGELFVEPPDGTPPLRIPVDVEYAVHVTRDSPSDTVRALAIATDAELCAEYDPANMTNAAAQAMKDNMDEVFDVLREVDGPSNLQRLDTQE